MSGSFGKGLGCTGRMESASGRISIVLIQVQQIHNYIILVHPCILSLIIIIGSLLTVAPIVGIPSSINYAPTFLR